jgi:clan AA aspartic protease
MSNTGPNKEPEMGRVTTPVILQNFPDLWSAQNGQIGEDEVRTVNVEDALVDTGCTLVGLPRRMIEQLGLMPFSTKKVVATSGASETTIYGAVRLTIQGRSCTMDVMEVDESCPVLIGQLPLEHLDFVVNPREHTLVGNPRHNGEHMYELL